MDHLPAIVCMLRRLHLDIIMAHEKVLEPAALIRYRTIIGNSAAGRLHLGVQSLPLLEARRGHRDADFVNTVMEQYLNPAMGLLFNTSRSAVDGRNVEDIFTAAKAFVLFFTGCLVLYIPERIYDPAFKSMIERNRHLKRKVELESTIEALKSYEKACTGQYMSSRSKILQSKLDDLGKTPPLRSVRRPQQSALSELQAVMGSLLELVVRKSPSEEALGRLMMDDELQRSNIELLKSHIVQYAARLSSEFKNYNDMTRPLASLLHGLDIGLGLALIAHDSLAKDILVIHRLTPFFGLVPNSLTVTKSDDLQSKASPMGLRLLYLESAALNPIIGANLQHSNVQTVLEIFHSFYKEWKEQLDSGQKEYASRSALYRYRGSKDDHAKEEEQEFLEIFPGDNTEQESKERSTRSQHDPRVLSQNLAYCHRNLLSFDKKDPQQILHILNNAAEYLNQLPDRSTTCPVPTDDFLPLLMVQLDQYSSSVHKQSTDQATYNFYTDANVSEVKKLTKLLHSIQARYLDLEKIWLEHETIKEVLKNTDDILHTNYTKPIAQLLHKTEQLHSCMHEWNMIASREYSSDNLYNELTTLLISWRRLELSTWASLLDNEDSKCSADVDAWWFIAYEAIVAVPLSVLDSGQAVDSHVEQLLLTLSDFLQSTTIGLYNLRIRMIAQFKNHIRLIAEQLPPMKKVEIAIENLLNFYQRFIQGVENSLIEGRKALEKEMKEILLLASWKDTNINALRESARRSHHKLFKVVRKYRKLLAQPAEQHLLQVSPNGSDTVPLPPSLASSTVKHDFDRALRICQKSIPWWSSKPSRFKDPLATAAKMVVESEFPAAVTNIAHYLEDYTQDLQENARLLQEKSPPTRTKACDTAAKHLTQRKRKLFTDTLRDIRRMGFQSNMSSSILAEQGTLPKILSNTPAFTQMRSNITFSTIEASFHKFLALLVRTREQARNPAAALSRREISRSIGYLERMLAVTLEQRAVLAPGFSELNVLDQIIETMNNLAAFDSLSLEWKEIETDLLAADCAIHLPWVSRLLEAACLLLERHGRLGDIDNSGAIERLRDWKEKLNALQVMVRSLPILPQGIVSQEYQQANSQATALFEELDSTLQRWTEESPGIAFVFRQLRHWTNTPKKEGPTDRNGIAHVELAVIDNGLSQDIDSMLVAIQKLKISLSAMPSNHEEGKYLIRSITSLSSALGDLRLMDVTCALRSSVDQIQHVAGRNKSELRAICAMCAVMLPVIQQYRQIAAKILDRCAAYYVALCRLATVFAESCSQVLLQGFGDPTPSSAAEGEISEKLERGVGLGEGVGDENISKDIEDNEDLSELAQEKGAGDMDEVKSQDDAVDMNQDELEGNLDNAAGNEAGEETGSGEEQEDLDETVGNVDYSDTEAVDEKLWDGDSDSSKKDKGSEKRIGKTRKEQDSAPGAEDRISPGPDEGIDSADEEVGDGEAFVSKDMPQLDAQAQEEERLDLPEKMDLDNDDRSMLSDLQGSDLEEGSSLSKEELTDQHQDELGADSEENPDLEPVSEGVSMPEASEDVETGSDADKAANNEDGTSPDALPDVEPFEQEESLNQTYADDAINDPDQIAASDAHEPSQGFEQHDDSEEAGQAGAHSERPGQSANADSKDTATLSANSLDTTSDRMKGDTSRQDTSLEQTAQSQAYKKLGDTLEKWHRQQQQVRDALEPRDKAPPDRFDAQAEEKQYEHLYDEHAEADTQALGAATEEQVRALDPQAFDTEMIDQPNIHVPDDHDQQPLDEEGMTMKDQDSIQSSSTDGKLIPGSKTFIGNSDRNQERSHSHNEKHEPTDDTDEGLLYSDDNNITEAVRPNLTISDPSQSEARKLWSHYEVLTQPFSLILTEQLRLILTPTQATKMRGDYRTGKRLNIKRIIPYIASNYKRDKIWMRRSVPQKRNYQIMLAVDDSKSMGESGSGQLAFEALVLVAKSLSMLEVGEIAVVRFGEDVQVAHDFDSTLSAGAGVKIIQHFGFQQTKTDVRKLLAKSIEMFRGARVKAAPSSSTAELWQLLLIISDGLCEDHESIRRLVRQAREERIMIVFIIVDAIRGESIVDMSQAVFEPDPEGDGGQKLKIKRYLDEFPFIYYLVVGNVKELPGVLATALRQWFSEVVGQGG